MGVWGISRCPFLCWAVDILPAIKTLPARKAQVEVCAVIVQALEPVLTLMFLSAGS